MAAVMVKLETTPLRVCAPLRAHRHVHARAFHEWKLYLLFSFYSSRQ